MNESVVEIIKKSDDYLLGRIHERASLEELEELIRLRLDNHGKEYKGVVR